MSDWLAAAILWLAPYVGAATAGEYAGLIEAAARRYRADPLVVLAIAHAESGWNPTRRSATNDYGLMQVHVSTRNGDLFRSREHALLDPATNIREGVRVLAMWRRYHERECRHAEHPYWAHYRSGYRAKVTSWELRIGAIRERLARWREGGDKQVAMRD